MVKTNINIVLISSDVSTRLVESVYLRRQKNRYDIKRSLTHKHVNVYVVLKYEFRASKPSPYLFEYWKILLYYTVKLLF